MVKKFYPNGDAYHEPPYTWEEDMEYYRRTSGGPITVVKGPPLEQRPKPQPGAKRPS